jgi:cell wall-associated NlpC family hydrolase
VKDVYRYVDGSPALPGDKVVSEALKYLGTPYVWAGASPTGGFDCSGLAMYVYGKLGVTLPHYSRYQASYGTAVSKDQLLPGDLVFFSTYRRDASHVGIYVGDDKFVHAATRGGQVQVDSLTEAYYAHRYIGARRLEI